uniref:AlNc14C94G5808 protein n=1 Tax=Albugo laibachii Nc14 TaxID=890382 RepID=F0WGT1_9STRA|nr:AlNc14C94G5808 [Albugo laibachii Nc14]|eukprot:CCA20445.1 AlNc14C94G5808 [Albugo laibachii Nc14]
MLRNRLEVETAEQHIDSDMLFSCLYICLYICRLFSDPSLSHSALLLTEYPS